MRTPSPSTPSTTTTTTSPIDDANGVLDELQGFYLVRADAEGWVYTSALRQLLNRMYRDRDYLQRRVREGKHTAYDYAVERDQKALAWTIRALIAHVPSVEKVRPEPPKPPRRPAQRLSADEKARTKGRPSWNGQPKRDWTGPEVPPPRGRTRGA